jgi:hypothetical protein
LMACKTSPQSASFIKAFIWQHHFVARDRRASGRDRRISVIYLCTCRPSEAGCPCGSISDSDFEASGGSRFTGRIALTVQSNSSKCIVAAFSEITLH